MYHVETIDVNGQWSRKCLENRTGNFISYYVLIHHPKAKLLKDIQETGNDFETVEDAEKVIKWTRTEYTNPYNFDWTYLRIVSDDGEVCREWPNNITLKDLLIEKLKLIIPETYPKKDNNVAIPHSSFNDPVFRVVGLEDDEEEE